MRVLVVTSHSAERAVCVRLWSLTERNGCGAHWTAELRDVHWGSAMSGLRRLRSSVTETKLRRKRRMPAGRWALHHDEAGRA